MKVFKSFFIIFGLLAINVSFTGAYFTSKVTVIGNAFETEVAETPTPARVVINEVYYHPNELHGGKNAEWIEIYNAGGTAVEIKDWYFKNNSDKKEIITQSYTLEPEQYLLVAANASIWNMYWDLIPSNAIKIALGGTLLFNGLVNGGDNLKLYNDSDVEIDAVSWGHDVSVFPSMPVADLGYSLSRKVAGVDTYDESDFENIELPTPGTQ